MATLGTRKQEIVGSNPDRGNNNISLKNVFMCSSVQVFIVYMNGSHVFWKCNIQVPGAASRLFRAVSVISIKLLYLIPG